MLLTKTLPPNARDDENIGQQLVDLLEDSPQGTSISFDEGAKSKLQVNKGVAEDEDTDGVLRTLEGRRN